MKLLLVQLMKKKKKPIPNPLKNKTFDNLDLDNDFDTDELFGKN